MEKFTFLAKPKKIKIRYLEIRLFIQKSSAIIQLRHLGCSGFSQKGREGQTQEVNEFQYELVRQNFKQYRNYWLGGRSVPPPDLDRVKGSQ